MLKDKFNDICSNITTTDNNISIPFVYESNNISNISITDLIAYEKACALICKKYEIVIRLNNENNAKFKKFSEHYQTIFNELEKRVDNLFKK